MNEHVHKPGDARKKALRLLEHMDRTEKGLKDRLLQGGFSQEETEDALDYVKSYGYLDDSRYALNYILYRIHDQSRDRIFLDLQRKGISRQTAEAAWTEAAELEPPDEHGLLLDTIEKKYPAGSALDEKELRRLYGYLARRGFHMGEISTALEELNIHSSGRI